MNSVHRSCKNSRDLVFVTRLLKVGRIELCLWLIVLAG
jgi:hypothetical protein